MDNRLEERYLVIKMKDLHEEGEQLIREMFGSLLVDGVVIEQDWPEYQPTVDLLMERVCPADD